MPHTGGGRSGRQRELQGLSSNEEFAFALCFQSRAFLPSDHKLSQCMLILVMTTGAASLRTSLKRKTILDSICTSTRHDGHPMYSHTNRYRNRQLKAYSASAFCGAGASSSAVPVVARIRRHTTDKNKQLVRTGHGGARSKEVCMAGACSVNSESMAQLGRQRSSDGQIPPVSTAKPMLPVKLDSSELKGKDDVSATYSSCADSADPQNPLIQVCQMSTLHNQVGSGLRHVGASVHQQPAAPAGLYIFVTHQFIGSSLCHAASAAEAAEPHL